MSSVKVGSPEPLLETREEALRAASLASGDVDLGAMEDVVVNVNAEATDEPLA